MHESLMFMRTHEDVARLYESVRCSFHALSYTALHAM